MKRSEKQYFAEGICGWHQSLDDSYDSQSTFDVMSTAFGARNDIHSDISDSGCSIVSTSEIASSNVNSASVFGRPIWRSSNYAEIARSKGNASALLKAYQALGADCLKEIGGDFCVVINDTAANRVIIGVDRMCRFPMYYHAREDLLVFGPSARTVLAHPAVARELSSQSLYNYVYFHMVPGPDSIYAHVKKLQAGQYLVFDSGRTHVRRHWLPRFSDHSDVSFAQLGGKLQVTLKAAVSKALSPGVKTAAFLSGGLDSSTVVGMLAEVSENTVDAYSIGFSAEGYDEMEYARLTARHFGVQLHEYYVTPDDVVTALPIIATSYDEPFGNSSALPAWFCAREAAKNGVQCLLAGDGGDELFAGNQRYAKQFIFEPYSRLPEWVREHAIEAILERLPEKFPLVGRARRYVELAAMSIPARLQAYNFLNLHDPEEVFSEDFLAHLSTSLPLDLLESVYDAPAATSSLNRMLYLDWQFTLADNDIRKVSHTCAMAGVDVRYPMLDDELLDFSCEVPSQWKLKRKSLRHFYKESLRGWLPDETISKKKQGFGLPFGYWMRDHKPLQEIAYDNLLKLKSRAYFNPVFIDDAIRLHRTGHAAYYGELVWIMTVLELWLQGATRGGDEHLRD